MNTNLAEQGSRVRFSGIDFTFFAIVSRVCFGQKLKHPLPLLFTFTFISPNSLRPLSLSTYFSLLVSLNDLSQISHCASASLSLSRFSISLSLCYAHSGVYKCVYMYCIPLLCSCLSVYLSPYASPGFVSLSIWVRVLFFFWLKFVLIWFKLIWVGYRDRETKEFTSSRADETDNWGLS